MRSSSGTVVLNGKKITGVDLDRALVDAEAAKEHPGLPRAGGHIDLQSHTDRVEFRDLRVQDLGK